MNCFIQKQHTSGYTSIPDDTTTTDDDDDDDNDTAVPLGTTILPPTTTSIHRSKWMVAIGMMMFMAYGVVLMQDGSFLYDHASGSLNTAAEDDGMENEDEDDELLLLESNTFDDDSIGSPCLPATDTFDGISTTTRAGKNDPFETCYQLANHPFYCWSKSHSAGELPLQWYECVPIDENPNPHARWHSVDPKYTNPVTHPYSCGDPCQKMVAWWLLLAHNIDRYFIAT